MLDCISYAKKTYGEHFIISCIGYPEGHPEKIIEIDDRPLTSSEASRGGYNTSNNINVCPDVDYNSELKTLKTLQDAGASYAVSNTFLDVGVFLQYCMDARAAGITMQIIPRIHAIASFEKLKHIIDVEKVRTPAMIYKTIETLQTDDKTCEEYGTRLAISTSKALLLRGIRHLHLSIEPMHVATTLLETLRLKETTAPDNISSSTPA